MEKSRSMRLTAAISSSVKVQSHIRLIKAQT